MEMWLDAGKYVEGLIILRDRFNFDGILVSIHGHFENWLRFEMNKKGNKPECPVCGDCYSRNDLFTSEGCHGLKLEGDVP